MIHSEGQSTLALLHELALLYLSLAHGADGHLDPAESDEIAVKLRRWQPDKDPALIDHVVREATLTYRNSSDTARMQEAADSLKSSLAERLREAILRDLADIARADGTVVSAEDDFIRRLAANWNIDPDQLETLRN